ncbi:MAG TPA: Gfo/Idh/MocA family oxidoreductase [bacterium]|nr:Gfo/Idh/MocA family oxidoreductase [bacterium]
MTSRSSRRQFLIRGAAIGGAAAFGSPLVPARPTPRTEPAARRRPSANERLRIGVIGCGGKGFSDMQACAVNHDIVALCDVDENQAARARAAHPKAAFFHDWRDMLDTQVLDAVTISTPDHSHAGPALTAMAKGLHVFVQKPLTHTVAEARRLRDAARKTGVITSMGNQGTCLDGLRTAVECVRAGAIGTVRDVHVWTNRPIWPQGIGRPRHIDPIPATLRWDLWLGPAAWRSYAAGRKGGTFRGYAPFHWRGFWDFGTGALGDMACHLANMPFLALGLGDPDWVEATSNEGGNSETAPKRSVIRFHFPPRGDRGEVVMHWYDGGALPPRELLPGVRLRAGGFLLVGDRGKLYSPTDYGERFELHPKEEFADFTPPPHTLPRSPGIHEEWLQGILDDSQPMANFEYAAPFTEAILLGNLALRCEHRIEWDAPNLRVKNSRAAQQLVSKHYRRGFELPDV